jgi:uncharacterized membrane protein
MLSLSLLLGLEVLSDRRKIAATLFVRDILCFSKWLQSRSCRAVSSIVIAIHHILEVTAESILIAVCVSFCELFLK